MARLDEIRAKLQVEKPRDVDLKTGELSANVKDAKTLRDRYVCDACPACGHPKMMELGLRHGGIHWRCPICTFEYTRKNFEAGQEDLAEKHLQLVINAANRATARKIAEMARIELYRDARKEHRRKWTILEMANGSRDAELKFGDHNGKLISEIAETQQGRGYLRWMKGADFDDEIKEIIDEHVSDTDGRRR
jgi:transposase-like protein